MHYALVPLLIARSFPPQDEGTLVGVMFTAEGLAGLIVPLAGDVADRYGWSWALRGTSVCPLLAALLMLTLKWDTILDLSVTDHIRVAGTPRVNVSPARSSHLAKLEKPMSMSLQPVSGGS